MIDKSNMASREEDRRGLARCWSSTNARENASVTLTSVCSKQWIYTRLKQPLKLSLQGWVHLLHTYGTLSSQKACGWCWIGTPSRCLCCSYCKQNVYKLNLALKRTKKTALHLGRKYIFKKLIKSQAEWGYGLEENWENKNGECHQRFDEWNKLTLSSDLRIKGRK